MFSAAIDVFIGISLLYLGLSLTSAFLCHGIFILTLFKARNLQTLLFNIVDDTDLRRAMLDHGILVSARKASGGSFPTYIEGSDLALAMLGAVGGELRKQDFATLEASVSEIGDSRIRDVLQSLMAHANHDFALLGQLLADWFNRTLDQTTGFHFRQLTFLGFIITVTLTIFLNADSIRIAQVLWQDRVLASQIIELSAERTNNSADTRVTQMFNQDIVYPSTMLTYLAGINEDIRPLPLGWKHDEAIKKSPYAFSLYLLHKFAGLLLTATTAGYLTMLWLKLLEKWTVPRRKTTLITGP